MSHTHAVIKGVRVCSNPKAHNDGKTLAQRKVIGAYMGRLNGISDKLKRRAAKTKKEKGVAAALGLLKKVTG